MPVPLGVRGRSAEILNVLRGTQMNSLGQGQFGGTLVETPLKISDNVAKSKRLIDPSLFRSLHAQAVDEDGEHSAQILSGGFI